MSKREILIATKNKGKLREMQVAFADIANLRSLEEFGDIPDAVENGNTFEENARIKAKFYHEMTKLPTLADDSGLEVDALGGAPGIHSARFAGFHGSDAANNEKLLQELSRINVEESKADYRCALCFYDKGGEKEILTEGRLDGIIKKIPRGKGGFGYDPFFYLDNGKTLAELTPKEKDEISHRGHALRRMVRELEGYFK